MGHPLAKLAIESSDWWFPEERFLSGPILD